MSSIKKITEYIEDNLNLVIGAVVLVGIIGIGVLYYQSDSSISIKEKAEITVENKEEVAYTSNLAMGLNTFEQRNGFWYSIKSAGLYVINFIESIFCGITDSVAGFGFYAAQIAMSLVLWLVGIALVVGLLSHLGQFTKWILKQLLVFVKWIKSFDNAFCNFLANVIRYLIHLLHPYDEFAYEGEKTEKNLKVISEDLAKQKVQLIAKLAAETTKVTKAKAIIDDAETRITTYNELLAATKRVLGGFQTKLDNLAKKEEKLTPAQEKTKTESAASAALWANRTAALEKLIDSANNTKTTTNTELVQLMKVEEVAKKAVEKNETDTTTVNKQISDLKGKTD